MTSSRPDKIIWEIALAVTLSSLIIVAALATIIQMDNDLIASEAATQVADLPHPQTHSDSITANAPASAKPTARQAANRHEWIPVDLTAGQIALR
jgi:hypothetical protein